MGAQCPKVNSLIGASLFIKRAFDEKKERKKIGFLIDIILLYHVAFILMLTTLFCLQYDTSRVILGRKNKAKGQNGHIN